MQRRPRGPWVLAWAGKLIVKPERSHREIHSAQRTCLEAGLGRDWEAIEPPAVAVVWGGPRALSDGPGLSHSSV